MSKRAIRALIPSIGLALLLPAFASAQTLAGVVRDASAAVLPGVTVEAASAALIEKVRSATTDGNGQYRIPDLPPGAYNVTYTLPGTASTCRSTRVSERVFLCRRGRAPGVA